MKIDQCLVKKGFGCKILIKKCLSIKKEYLEIDEFDKNERQILNYGHTFGHAIESETSYKIPHGIAVMYGIQIVNNISVRLNLLSVEKNIRISNILNKLISLSNIDTSIYNSIDMKKLLNYTKLDKKKLFSIFPPKVFFEINYKLMLGRQK